MLNNGVRNRFLAALAALVVTTAAPAGHDACDPTVNDCQDVNATTSHIQIGGPGSLSSNDTCGGFPCDDPGRLDNGTIATARLDFALDRAAGTLTLVFDNTTDTAAALTGIYFNTPDGVTGLAIAAGYPTKTCPPTDTDCPVIETWSVVLDPANIQADGFGRFDAYVGNSNNPGAGGGNPTEILAGEVLTVVLNLTGDLTGVTACSFTSEGTKIPPGEKVVTGVGRFQSGANNGDSGWLGPCNDNGSLLIVLKFFETDPEDSKVVLRWETGSELDNAGFNILRKPELGGPWERVNGTLLPAVGDTLVGAAYTFTDASVRNGVRYIYRLEDIDLTGFNTMHPPEQAVPNPKNPPIRLSAPAYGTAFGRDQEIRLAWTTRLRSPERVQFSADPAFPEGNRVEFPARASRGGGQFEMTLNPHERMLVDAVIAGSDSGQIYWRVVESPRGRDAGATSDVSRLGGAR